ncbi:MAG: hypothetical protein ACXWSC_04925 [Bdellovibrionota bacterium]
MVCREANVKFNIIAGRGGIAYQGAIVTIVANGVLHTVIDAQVDSVDTSQPGKVIAAVTTLDQDGQVTDDSGKATIELAVNARSDGKPGLNANGAGSIKIQKNPPEHPAGIIFRPEYPLNSCVGSVQ